MYNERANITSEPLFRIVHLYRTFSSITLWKKMTSTSNECQLQLVLQTFEKDPHLNIHEVVRLFNILRTILTYRINNRSIYTDIIPNL